MINSDLFYYPFFFCLIHFSHIDFMIHTMIRYIRVVGSEQHFAWASVDTFHLIWNRTRREWRLRLTKSVAHFHGPFFFLPTRAILFFSHFKVKWLEHVKRWHSIMFGEIFSMISKIFLHIKQFDIQNGCLSTRMSIVNSLVLWIFLFRQIFDFSSNGRPDNAGLVGIFRNYLRTYLENHFQVDYCFNQLNFEN